MSPKRCLYCYLPLEENEKDFHEKCCRKFFGTATQPELNLDPETFEKLAGEIVNRSIAVAGVQPKLSLTVEKKNRDHKNARFTIVGLWGNYILKPQSALHVSLPENEDLSMHLAALLDISVAEHSLVRSNSGELAYVTKRFDRGTEGEKFQCEDLCQLSEELTDAKYRGSMEKAGKVLKKNVANPLLDAIRFFELALFSFITGNADMHLKNFSILKRKRGGYGLSPAYDLLSTRLAVPEDLEEMALTVNGRKNKITRNDFDQLALSLGMDEKQSGAVYKKFQKQSAALFAFIDTSFLPVDLKTAYKALLGTQLQKLKLD